MATIYLPDAAFGCDLEGGQGAAQILDLESRKNKECDIA
jgi:hypothetical protein